jgi:uncharacterized protein (DUF302 family)
MSASTSPGIRSRRSAFSVEETLDRLTRSLRARGLTIFAIVDHAGEAQKVGLRMPATKVVIFGSPTAGTPVMLAAPSVALDLPLKILIRDDGEATTWVSYNDPAYLQERHGLPADLVQNLGAAEALVAAVTA